MIRDQLRHLDYPRAPIPVVFEPTELPSTLPELARGVLHETRLDPLRCSLDQFAELKLALGELSLVREVLELLPSLHLAHCALVLGDHEALAALEVRSEDSIRFYEYREACSRVEVEEAVGRWSGAYAERAAQFYARAEQLLGL